MIDEQPSRHAGPIALVAGGAFAAIDVVLLVLMDPAHKMDMLTSPVFRVFNAAYFFAFVGLAIGLIAVHSRLGSRTGVARHNRLPRRTGRHDDPGRQHAVRRRRLTMARRGAP